MSKKFFTPLSVIILFLSISFVGTDIAYSQGGSEVLPPSGVVVSGSANPSTADTSVTLSINGSLSAVRQGGDCSAITPSFEDWWKSVANSGSAQITAGTFVGQSIPISVTVGTVGTGCTDAGEKSQFSGSKSFATSALSNGSYSSTVKVTDNLGNSNTAVISFSVNHPVLAPTVNLRGRVSGSGSSYSNGPLTVSEGDSIQLSWSITNSPTTCSASGDWSGAKSVSGGTQTVGPLSSGTYTFNITCSNSAGSDSDTFIANANVCTGSITVSSNVATTWDITGPQAQSQTTDATNAVYSNVPSGTYSIVNLASQSGYVNPPAVNASSQTLSCGGDITFNVNYNQTTESMLLLSVSIIGTGSGNVTSGPVGVNCGSVGNDCDKSFEEGSFVSLIATADAGSTFTGWSGDADCSDGSVTMNSDKNCVATFNLDEVQTANPTLTVSIAGTGSGTVTSSPSGINCGTDCSESYTSGQVVNLTPTANAGSTFIGWSGHADCSDNSVTMNGDRNCVATFDGPSTGTISVSAQDQGGAPVSATWSLTGPTPQTQSTPSSSVTYSSQDAGSYNLIPNAVSGYISASISPPNPQTLSAGGTIDFIITYSKPECSDGIDNLDTEDTLVDLADPGCADANDNDERDVAGGPGGPSGPGGTLPECGDGLDNDGDGNVDIDDADCHTDGDPTNDGTYNEDLRSEGNPEFEEF